MNTDELKSIEALSVFPGKDGLIENGEIQKYSKKTIIEFHMIVSDFHTHTTTLISQIFTIIWNFFL